MAQGLLDTGFTASLLHFNGSNLGTVFTDESGKAWAAGGNACTKIDAYKFSPTSLYLDGAGDYVSTADHADFYLVGNFTLDCWIRFADFPVAGGYYQLFEQFQGANDWQTLCFTNAAGVHSFNWQIKTGGVDNVNFTRNPASNLSLNTWYHFRICRYGNDYKMYLGGVKLGATENDASAVPNYTGTVYIGSHAAAASYFNGWIDEFRLINGKAMVTGDSFDILTVPYAPHIDDAYTESLLHFNGLDSRTLLCDEAGLVWTCGNQAQIDTAQSKFGGSSLLSDGASDYITTPDSSVFFIGTNDFTIEVWARFSALPAASGYGTIFSYRQDDNNRMVWWIYNNAGTYELRSMVVSAGVILFAENRALAGIAHSVWYHYAWSRESQINRFFWDGVQLGADAPDSSSIPDFAGPVYLMAMNTTDNSFAGWFDEFRFSNGISRYNANFTPETSAFGPVISHSESLSAYDTHALYDNTLLMTLPLLEMDFSGYWELRKLEFTLPLLEANFHGLSGMISSLNFPLPLLNVNLNGLTGEVGNIDLDLPLPVPAFYGGGNLDIYLPNLEVTANMLVGAAGQINAILPRLVVSVLSHLDGIGQINLSLPRMILNFTGMQRGFGSMAFNLPPLGFSGNILSGAVGSMIVDLPQLKVNVHSYHGGLAQLDITLPSLVVDIYGRVRPATVTYRGVVINTKNMSVTEYEGFEFNSLASVGNVSLAANENGIHVLRGSRMSGGPVDSRILSGLMDFGKDVLTVPKDVWLSMRADGQLTLTVRTEEGEEYSYPVPGLKDALHEERVKLGRGLKGRFFDFALENIEGADFDLSKIAIMVDTLRDRKR